MLFQEIGELLHLGTQACLCGLTHSCQLDASSMSVLGCSERLRTNRPLDDLAIQR